MTINNLFRVLVVLALFFLSFSVTVRAQGNCEATTLDQFYECYGGKSAFSAHSVKALTTFIQAEDAIKADNYSQAKLLIDDLYKIYPVDYIRTQSGASRDPLRRLGAAHHYMVERVDCSEWC